MIQWKSKRLGTEVISLESALWGVRNRIEKLRCIQCKDAPVWHDIEFGASFCTPGCYRKFNREFLKAMEECNDRTNEDN